MNIISNLFKSFTRPKRVYFDYAGSTPMDNRVRRHISEISKLYFANPSGLHQMSKEASQFIEEARKQLKDLLCAVNHDIIFTRGGTESCNLAITHALHEFSLHNAGLLPEVIISPLEHSSVYETCLHYQRKGEIDLKILDINPSGHIDISHLDSLISPATALVCVQLLNSETGHIQPIKKLAHHIRQYKHQHNNSQFPLLMCDAVQSGDVVDLSVQSLGADYVALSASKFYGPKSGGILCVPHSRTYQHGILFGGSQEFGLRSGTEDIPLIAGTVKAYSISVNERTKWNNHRNNLKAKLISALRKDFPSYVINTPDDSAPHIVHFSIPNMDSEFAVLYFDVQGACVSSQSACSSGSGEVSRVIEAIWSKREFDPNQYAHIRISLGRNTTTSDIDMLLALCKKLPETSYFRGR